MMQKLDSCLERFSLEGQILWAFIQGHIIMMGIPSIMWYGLIQQEYGQRDDIAPFVVGILIAIAWAVICWALMRFRFPYASERFINFTRIVFHFVLTLVLWLVFSIPNLLRPDPPSYISNKEILFLAMFALMIFIPLLPREAIFSTTRTYLKLRDSL